MNKWIVYIYTSAGYPCGFAAANRIRAVVDNAQERMPWLHRHMVRKMVRKTKQKEVKQ